MKMSQKFFIFARAIQLLIAAIVLAASPAMADTQTEIQRSMDRAKAIAAQDRYHDTESCRARDHARRALDQNTLAKARGVQGLDAQIARIANDVEVWTALCDKDLNK
jgi:hypothetical protein